MKLRIMVDEGMEPPAYAHEGDAGLDLRITEDVWIHPHQRMTVGTGVRVAIPEGYVGLVFPRSGLASKLGISLSNCVGVIDAGYRGEVGATLVNNDKKPHLLMARGARLPARRGAVRNVRAGCRGRARRHRARRGRLREHWHELIRVVPRMHGKRMQRQKYPRHVA